MKTKKLYMTLAAALFSVFAAAAASYAGGVGSFTAVDGRVDLLKPGQTRAEAVKKGDTVTPGDIVRTKSNSQAEIVFEDGAVLRISESSRMEIKDYLMAEDGKRKNGIMRLLRGKIRATVPKALGRIIPITKGPATFEVETPTAVAGVRGTDFFVSFDRGTTGVFVLEGTVETRNRIHSEEAVMVNAGYFSLVRPDEPARGVSAIQNMTQIIKEGESVRRHSELQEARGEARHDDHRRKLEHLREREMISGGSVERIEGAERRSEHIDSVERPVSETDTTLLEEGHH